MLTIKSKAMESSFGLMADATKESGKMVNRMGRAHTRTSRISRGKECGQTERRLNGPLDRFEIIKLYNDVKLPQTITY